jgi:hypothetical protein
MLVGGIGAKLSNSVRLQWVDSCRFVIGRTARKMSVSYRLAT